LSAQIRHLSIEKGSEEVSLSLADLEIRYANIRKANPKVKKCTVKGCNNPRDSTPSLGEDTCCAYHRLLFDFWSSDVVDWNLDKLDHYLKSRKGRRRAFSNWLKRTGKEALDKLVLRMAQEPINWEC
jgi:hypothetical protein